MSMAGLLGTVADGTRQPYSWVSRYIANTNGTLKRKRVDDDLGSPSAWGSYSELQKRQKDVNNCNQSEVEGRREYLPRDESIDGKIDEEEKSRSSRIGSLVSQTIYV